MNAIHPKDSGGMIRRWIVCLGAVGALGVALVGCAGATPAVADLSIEQAKEIAQAGELAIAARVPVDAVTSTDQTPQGSLLSCDGDRNYRWAGHTKILLRSGAEFDELTRQVADATATAEGWSVEQDTMTSGEPRLTMSTRDGAIFVMSARLSDPPRYQVSSMSPCFHLADDESPLGSF